MTESSILHGGAIGNDAGWEISDRTQDVVDELIKALSEVALPFFSVFSSESSLDQRGKDFRTDVYALDEPDTDLENVRDALGDGFTSKASIKVPKGKDVLGWVADEMRKSMTEYRFEEVRQESLVYLRQRNEIFDVVKIVSINYGVHVGVHAFNWIAECALDGSGQFSESTALALNGGLVAADGRFSRCGSPFLAYDRSTARESARHLVQVLEVQALPALERVDDWFTFRDSIPDMLLPTVKRLPALATRLSI